MNQEATATPPLPPAGEPLRPAELFHDVGSANGPVPSNGPGLRSAEFRHGRELGWRRLEDMIDRVEKRGIGELSADEVRELPLLYRAAV